VYFYARAFPVCSVRTVAASLRRGVFLMVTQHRGDNIRVYSWLKKNVSARASKPLPEAGALLNSRHPCNPSKRLD